MSCVVEYVIRRERAEDLDRISAPADCVVLFTSSSAAQERVANRNLQDRLLNRRAVLDALGHLTIEDHTSDAALRMEQVRLDMKTEFDLPTMQINTDNVRSGGGQRRKRTLRLGPGGQGRIDRPCAASACVRRRDGLTARPSAKLLRAPLDIGKHPGVIA